MDNIDVRLHTDMYIYIYICQCTFTHVIATLGTLHTLNRASILAFAKVFAPLSKTPTACSTRCPPTSRGQRLGVAPEAQLMVENPMENPMENIENPMENI